MIISKRTCLIEVMIEEGWRDLCVTCEIYITALFIYEIKYCKPFIGGLAFLVAIFYYYETPSTALCLIVMLCDVLYLN